MGAPLRDLERKHRIERLAPHHRAMARAVAAGARPTDIVENFGVTPSWATQILHSPLFKAEVKRLTSELDERQVASQRQINDELDMLLERSVEVIAQELHASAPSARRTDTAFKILDRRGYHPKNEQGGEDNRQFNFITLTPEPGEDPADAMKRINAVVREMRREQGGQGDVQQDSWTDSWANDEAEWPEGSYALQRADTQVDGKQVYCLQLVDGSKDQGSESRVPSVPHCVGACGRLSDGDCEE